MEILTWRSHTVLKPKAEGQYCSWRSEFPYCSQTRQGEWHSIFSIAFWSLQLKFDKTGLACLDSMEIPSIQVSYQVWNSMQCVKIECAVSIQCCRLPGKHSWPLITALDLPTFRWWGLNGGIEIFRHVNVQAENKLKF